MRAVNRLVGAVLAIAVLASISVASATTLGISARSVGAGAAAVGKCDNAFDSVTFTHDASGNATQAHLSGISTDCREATGTLSLVDATGSQRAGGSFQVGTAHATDTIITVALSPATQPPSAFAKAHVAMVGP